MDSFGNELAGLSDGDVRRTSDVMGPGLSWAPQPHRTIDPQ